MRIFCSLLGWVILIAAGQAPAFANDSLYETLDREAKKAHKSGDSSRAISMLELAIKENIDVDKKIIALNNLAGCHAAAKNIPAAKDAVAKALALCVANLNETDPIFVRTKANYERIKAMRESLDADPSRATAESPVSSIQKTSDPQILVGEASRQVVPKPEKFIWSASNPNCDREVIDGADVETIRGGNLRVSATLLDTGERYKVFLRVANEGDTDVEVWPHRTSITVVGKKLRQLKYEDIDRLTESIAKRARLDANLASFACALNEMNSAKRTVTSTGYSTFNGTHWGRSSLSPFGSTDYCSGSVLTTVTSPDLGAQARAMKHTEKTETQYANYIDQVDEVANQLREMALKGNTLRKGESVSGAVFFKQGGQEKVAVVSLEVGKCIYAFSFELRPTSSTKQIARAIWYGPDWYRRLDPFKLLGGRNAYSTEYPMKIAGKHLISEAGAQQ